MRFPFKILLILLCSVILALPLFGQIDHQTPEQAFLGENIRLEVNNLNTNQPIYEAKVFYRMQGEGEYESANMRQEGFLFFAELSTKNLSAGNLEYYFAFQTSVKVNYLPETSPQLNPFNVKILPVQKNNRGPSNKGIDIFILSPDPEELISPEDFVLALSLPVDLDEMSNLRYSLLLSGIDKSKLLQQEGNLLSYAPNTIRSGLHNAEFKVFNKSGQIVGQRSFSFRISGQPSLQKGFNSRTSVFLDNRYQNISKTSDDLFRGGINFFSSYKQMDFRALVLVSSEEAYDRQSINQFGAQLRYNLSPTFNFYLKGGDFSTNYDQLVFWEKRVRGAGFGMYSKYFDLDITYGQTLKAVEGKSEEVTRTIINPDSSVQTITSDSTTRFGTFKRSFLAIQPKVNIGKYFSWGLNLVNGKDDPNSIKYGINPKESLVLGTTMLLQLDGNKVQVKGSVQASMKNEDAEGTVEFDTLADAFELSGSEKDLAESLFNFLDNTGFLTLSQGLSPLPSLAMQFQARLKYFNQIFRFNYKNIDAEYTTPGNPYLLKDIKGFFINDNIRLVNNQLFLNLYFNSFQDNLSQEDAKTDNTQFGATISYYPFQNLPGVSLNYGNQRRENQLAKNNVSPDSTFLLIEDNETQRVSLSSSYKFITADVKNTISISASNFKRNDLAYKDEYANRSSQSDFTIYTLGLRNEFAFPLTSKFSYSKTASLFGKGDSERETDINKIFFGLDYLFRQAFLEGDLKPYFNFTYQSITNNNPILPDYNRLNYTGGLTFRATQYGTFSLRFDYIDFGDINDWSDTIFSTRYEINF